MLKTERVNIKTAELSCKIVGSGKIDVVVELGLGSGIGEWLHIAEKLSNKHTVLLYERAGCGMSGASALARTPENIAKELGVLLDSLDCKEQVILIAHSQGGLYAQQFARLYPNRVASLILLDPLSANDGHFKQALTPEEYKKGGIDKFSKLKLPYVLSRLGMGWLIKMIMKSAPPFYYFSGFSPDASEYILNCLARPLAYKTAMEEYRLSHEEENIKQLREKDVFPNIPLHLITHSSKAEIDEIMQFGGASKEQAEKVESIWQGLMREYTAFSDKSDFSQAERSTHYIHLTEFELVERFL